MKKLIFIAALASAVALQASEETPKPIRVACKDGRTVLTTEKVIGQCALLVGLIENHGSLEALLAQPFTSDGPLSITTDGLLQINCPYEMLTFLLQFIAREGSYTYEMIAYLQTFTPYTLEQFLTIVRTFHLTESLLEKLEPYIKHLLNKTTFQKAFINRENSPSTSATLTLWPAQQD